MQQATRRITHKRPLVLGLLVLAVGSLAGLVRADHALSEVWSEGDGLQMKYLTNHDDLLSTRGSELSLGSSEAPTKQAGSAAPEADESPAGEPAGESGAAKEAEGNEEGADSSRQSERVPLKQHQRQRFSEPPPRYRQVQEIAQPSSSSESSADAGPGSGDQEEADEGAEGSPPGQKQQAAGASRYPESESASFGAALEQADEGGETANVDHGADEQQQQPAPEESPRFRPPGRLFKEAVKMGGQLQDLGEKSSGQQQEQESNANNEQSEEQNDVATTSQQKQAEPNQGAAAAAAAAAAEEEAAAEPAGAGEPDFNGPPEEGRAKEAASERAFRPRQNMIDFDRLPGGASSRQRPTGSEAQRPRRPQPMGGGQRNEQPFAGFYPQQRHHMASAGSSTQQRLPATTGAAASPVARPQGNYFRGLQQQQQQQAPSADNERDNFISPGHFPGSMPHLTQAASEPVADKAPETGAKPAAASASPSQQVASDSSPSAVVHQVSASEQKPQIVTKSPEAPPPPPQVTPQPEAQPESQQIMAPILLSTTTMAPMPAAAGEAASSTANATATSTAAPSLKRFKFRKYR